jgi:hypothetical protein
MGVLPHLSQTLTHQLFLTISLKRFLHHRPSGLCSSKWLLLNCLVCLFPFVPPAVERYLFQNAKNLMFGPVSLTGFPIGFVIVFCLGPASDYSHPTYDSCIAGTTDTHHYRWFVGWDGVLLNFWGQAGLKLWSVVSWIAGITSVSHHTQLWFLLCHGYIWHSYVSMFSDSQKRENI